MKVAANSHVNLVVYFCFALQRWPYLVSGRDQLRGGLEEEFHHLRVVAHRRHVHRLLPRVVGGVRVGAELQQRVAHLQVPRLGRQVQRGLFFLHERIYVFIIYSTYRKSVSSTDK